MVRVLVTDRIGEEGLAILRAGADVEVRIGISPSELVDIIPEYHALVVRSETKVTAEVLAAARNLVVVGRAGVGVDNIDVDAATRHGIVVVNAPEANTISMAEHAIGLMLALARHIPEGSASLRSGAWERSRFVGVELRGKTLGLVGLGRTGTEVARRARGLEMNVIAYDEWVGPERFQILGVTPVTLEELLAQSDFISLHIILPSGGCILNKPQFALMKPGVRIINAARGSLINEAALLEALDNGRVAGAALDVFDQEPPPADLGLLKHPNVIVTPHLGGSTTEAQERLSTDVADQILASLRGQPAMFAVNMTLPGAEAFAIIAPYVQPAMQAGSLAAQLASGQFESVEIEYLGELAGLEVGALKSAVIRGLLASVTEENVTLVNATLIAEQRGLKIVEVKGDYEGIYKDLIRVHLTTRGGRTTVSATVAHDGPHIVEINDFWVDIAAGEGYLLLVENVDQPGMIGRIGTFIGEKNINISFMRVGREKVQGRALMVLGLDDQLDEQALTQIAAMPKIFSARTVRL